MTTVWTPIPKPYNVLLWKAETTTQTDTNELLWKDDTNEIEYKKIWTPVEKPSTPTSP